MKKIISIIILLYVGVALKAQNNEIITLVVNGDGQTKEAATASALRSAIEQAFGTFVSANTTILNDELVKDEIATVTSGNIKSYKEISDIHNPDGTHSVTVSATVSIGNLISYAQSHGSSAEFAGQTFAMNIKMMELNKQNEKEALLNLIAQLKKMRNSLFDYQLQVGDPVQQAGGQKWIVPLNVSINPNDYFFDILTNTMSSISLSEEEKEMYKKHNIPTTSFEIEEYRNEPGKRYTFDRRWQNTGIKWSFRNDLKFIAFEIGDEIAYLFDDARNSFIIKAVGGTEKEVLPFIEPTFRYIASFSNSGGGSLILVPNIEYDWPLYYQTTINMELDFNELSSVKSFKIEKTSAGDNRWKYFISYLERSNVPYSVRDQKIVINIQGDKVYPIEIDPVERTIRLADSKRVYSEVVIRRYSGRYGNEYNEVFVKGWNVYEDDNRGYSTTNMCSFSTKGVSISGHTYQYAR